MFIIVCVRASHSMHVGVRGQLTGPSPLLLPIWVLGIELRLSDLTAGTFTCCGISQAHAGLWGFCCYCFLVWFLGDRVSL